MSVDQLKPAMTAATPATAERTDVRRLTGWRLDLARVVWVTVLLVNVAAYITGLPAAWDIARDLSPFAVEQLHSIGLSPWFPATYLLVLDTAMLLTFLTVAVIIFRRSSDEPAALIASSMLVFTAMLYTAAGYEARVPVFIIAGGAALAELSQITFLLTFPNGRFFPRRSWMLLPLLFVWRYAVWYLDYIPNLYSLERIGDSYPFLPQDPIDLVLFAACLLLAFSAQVVRYRRTSDPVQRQQMKWLVWGLAMVVIIVGGYAIALNTVPFLNPVGGNVVVVRLVGRTVRQAALTIVPITLLYSLLRYHMWGVDVLINRTLVYVPLTSLLAGLFAGALALTQRFFMATTGQRSDAAVVVTTLILYAAFTPIKNEMQGFVDRRFKEAPDPLRQLKDFDRQVQSVVEVIDADRICTRLLSEATSAFGALGGAVFLLERGETRVVATAGDWPQPVKAELSLAREGRVVGTLALGARRSGDEYSEDEWASLQTACNSVARAIELMHTHRVSPE
jgi:hypothetical protein